MGKGCLSKKEPFQVSEARFISSQCTYSEFSIECSFFFFKILSTRLFHITYLEVILLQWSTQNRSFYLFLFFNTFRLGSL